MSRSSLIRLALWARRLMVLTIVLAPAVLLVLLALFWIGDRIPEWVYWKTGLIFLIAVEAAYVVTAVLAVLGIPVLILLWFRRRRSGASRLAVARGLLLCLSLLFGLGLAEAGSAGWQILSQQATAMPIGGLREVPRWAPTSPMPKAGNETPFPTEFPDPRDDREIDLVVVGESSAEGVPYNQWFSIGSLVAWQLQQVLPRRPVRLQVLASSGDTLENQHRRFDQLQRRPDIMIIYCGHNEIASRFDAGRDLPHYDDQRLPTTWSVLVERLESISPLCGMAGQAADKCRIAIPPPKHGYRALIDVPAYTPTEYIILLVDFRRRLEATVSYAERVGAVPVLILPPGNDAGYEPNRSFLSAAMPRPERAAFRRDFLAARRLEATDPEGARAAYRALLARQPGFAEAHYRLAQLLERAGAWKEAYRQYIEARDHDGYPARCLTAFQQVYHEVAARHGCILIDGQSYFHAIGHHGLLDDHLFQDAMHPSLRGQIALAQAVLHALQARGAFGWPKDVPAPTIDPAQCAAHFGLVGAAWRHLCLWGIMFYDLTYPMRYDRSHRLEQRKAYATAAERVEAGEAPSALGLPNVGVPEPVPAVSAAIYSGRPPDRVGGAAPDSLPAGKRDWAGPARSGGDSGLTANGRDVSADR